MAIYRLLQHSAFTPRTLPDRAAYEDCLRILELTNRSDPFTEIIAKASLRSRKPACAIRFNCASSRSSK